MGMLRTGQGLVGTAVVAPDGGLGSVRDFGYDDTTWRLRHLVVAIRDGRPNETVILPMQVLREPNEGRGVIPVALSRDEARRINAIDTTNSQRYHYRHADMMRGVPVATRDGPVGRVTDYLIEDHPWIVRGLIVRLTDGRFVLVPTSWIDSACLGEPSVILDADGEMMKEARSIDPTVLRLGIGSDVLREYCHLGK